MRILFLTQIAPYPPDAGPKVKTWHVIRALAEFGHEITLVTFVRQEEEKNLPPLSEICAEVYPVPLARSRIADLRFWLISQLTRRPFLVERDDIPEMRDLISRLLETKKFDAIHADQLTMAQFALPTLENNQVWPKTIFDAHNAVWTILDRMSKNAHLLLKPVLALERSRIKHFEGQMVCRFDHTLTVIDQDRSALIEAANMCPAAKNQTISVIPIAVDTNELEPVQRVPHSMNIMTLGTLHYPPNADGIRWFLNDVFPIIRQQLAEASLTIIGKNPPSDFLQAAAEEPDAIKVPGFVPDLTPYFEQSGVVVIPVRAGGGMRVRILEAFSRGVPVVTTTVGLEGIDAKANRDVLLADTPEDFAEAVYKLLLDRKAQANLGSAGRNLAVQKYDWHIVLEDLKILYPPDA